MRSPESDLRMRGFRSRREILEEAKQMNGNPPPIERACIGIRRCMQFHGSRTRTKRTSSIDRKRGWCLHGEEEPSRFLVFPQGTNSTPDRM